MNINKIKTRIENCKEWIYAHPKEFYKYSLIVIVSCFTFSVLKFILFPPPSLTGIEIPTVFSKSEKIIDKKKKNNEKIQAQMSVIVNELQKLKLKRENQGLSQADSLRIEYLYNQYQSLQNGK